MYRTYRMISLVRDHFPKIVSVGSCSIDELLKVPNLPLESKTVFTSNEGFFYGGKGANQAVACARLGAKSYFVGTVGMDPHGQQILRHLKDNEVNIAYVQESMDYDTGTAFVLESNTGNAVLIIPGANVAVTGSYLNSCDKVFHDADFLLTQSETPGSAVEMLISLSQKKQIPLGYYASPADRKCHAILDYCTFFLCKAADLKKIFEAEEDEKMLRQYPGKLILIYPDHTKRYADAEGIIHTIGTPAKVDYPLGMGDAFAGGLAFALAHNNAFESSVRFAHEVSLKTALHRGSQNALPYLKDLQSEIELR